MEQTSSPEACNEESEIPAKRRRGRPPKDKSVKEKETPHMPELSELEMAFSVVQRLIAMVKLKPLIVKPSESLYGLIGYNDVIEHPMWLLEISRKYEAKEYTDAIGIYQDLRLVLENCYRFWGPAHKFTQIVLRAERVIIKSISEFKAEVRGKCCMALYDDENYCPDYKQDFTSRIFQNLAKVPAFVRPNLSEEELLKWEKEVLLGDDVEHQIKVMPELAEIGHLLSLTREMLSLKAIPQFEIERMLMMPKESIALATIMTNFLCPKALRPSLYFKPLMVYNVWVHLLKKKLDVWYNAFAKYNDRLTVFTMYGVEPTFFERVGEINPLNLVPFHELSFVQRVTILKAFCLNVFQSEKAMEDYFTTLDANLLRPSIQFSDSNYCYTSMFTPEIRIYRTLKNCVKIGETMKSLYPNYVVAQSECDEGDSLSTTSSDNEESFLDKQQFYLVAHNLTGLKKLSRKLSKKKNKNKKSVKSFVNRLIFNTKSTKTAEAYLGALYNQWKEPINRDPLFVEASKSYWLTKVPKEAALEEAKKGSLALEPEASLQTSQSNVSVDGEIGKRTPRRRSQNNENMDESNFSAEENEEVGREVGDEDVSDWEDSCKTRRYGRFGKPKRKYVRRIKKLLNCSIEEGPIERKKRGRKEASFDIGDPSHSGRAIIQLTQSITVEKRKKRRDLSLLNVKVEPFELPDEPYTPSIQTIDVPKTENGTPFNTSSQVPIVTDMHDWGPISPVSLAPVPKSADDGKYPGKGKLLELGTYEPASNQRKRITNKVLPGQQILNGKALDLGTYRTPLKPMNESANMTAQAFPESTRSGQWVYDEKSSEHGRYTETAPELTKCSTNASYQVPINFHSQTYPSTTIGGYPRDNRHFAQDSVPTQSLKPNRAVPISPKQKRAPLACQRQPPVVARVQPYQINRQPMPRQPTTSWMASEYNPIPPQPIPGSSRMPDVTIYRQMNEPIQRNVFLQRPVCFVPRLTGEDVVIVHTSIRPNVGPAPTRPPPFPPPSSAHPNQMRPHPELFTKRISKPMCTNSRATQNRSFLMPNNQHRISQGSAFSVFNIPGRPHTNHPPQFLQTGDEKVFTVL